MLNFFNENILPASERLQELLDLEELRDQKIRQEGEIADMEAKLEKEREEADCE